MVDHRRIAYRLERKLRGERRSTDRGEGRRRTDYEPNRGWKPAVVIALVIAIADWTVKWLVIQRVPLDTIQVVIEYRLALWHVRNPAMILGLYGSLPLEARIAIAAVSGLLGMVLLFEVVSRGHRLAPERRKWAWLFVGLASGGMMGNLGERIVHWGVTDYLSIGWGDLWLPPGNIADLAIFLSLPVAVLVVLFELQARAQRLTDRRDNKSVPTDTPRSSALGA
ncbi:MAG: signal peptidase II [Gemmatimonadetes bacterium]|nr:signal peptidase II [Gemmatimonadota bacterium]